MHQHPVVTKHQKVVADAVVAALRPLLEEMNRKLDMIAEMIETTLARLNETEAALREVTARLADAPPQAKNDS